MLTPRYHTRGEGCVHLPSSPLYMYRTLLPRPTITIIPKPTWRLCHSFYPRTCHGLPARGRPDSFRLQYSEGVDPPPGAASSGWYHRAELEEARRELQLRKADLPQVSIFATHQCSVVQSRSHGAVVQWCRSDFVPDRIQSTHSR